jgi:uncharacterized ion transporter superfamily protein YfcC
MTDAPVSAPRFRAPETTLVVFGVIVLAAVLTWAVPPGEYARDEIEVEGVGTREVVVPGSYERLEREAEGVGGRLLHTVAVVFQAPILGFVDPDAAPIIAFVLLVGGAFAVLTATGAVDAALRRVLRAAAASPALDAVLIPLFVGLFSLGGAVFGMSEETIPFVLIFVPLALALGYDSLTGAAIPFLGGGAGFAAAFLNPFTVGVAQGIAGVPLFSGAGFRVGLWVVITSAVAGFIVWHARRVRRDPALSPTRELDDAAREGGVSAVGEAAFTGRQRLALAVFGLGLVALVVGVLEAGWYIVEIAALFVALAAATGVAGGLGGNGTARAFMVGVRDLAPTALIIGLARGILVVLQDGQVVDTILYGMASGLAETGATVAAMSMFGAQTLINLFVPSGSGQAALTMPLMAPLADLVGVSRQTAVLAFQLGDGFTNMIIPTSPVLMGALSLARVPWTTWARWVLPLQVGLFGLGLAALTVATAVGF